MQHLLLEMEEEKSMRDAAVIVQPCSQRAFPARVSAGGAPGINVAVVVVPLSVPSVQDMWCKWGFSAATV